jgi:hypothetical protein
MTSLPTAFEWRMCTKHPGLVSESFCVKCRRAFCHSCSKIASHGPTCPICGDFCGATREQEEAETLAQLRSRSMWREIRVIARYPLVDIQSYVILGVSVALLNAIPVMGWLLGLGLLAAYGLHAMARVSVGDLSDFQPHFDSIADDLFGPAFLAICATFISAAPHLAWQIFLSPPSMSGLIQEGHPLSTLIAILCWVWQVGYFPMALIVAGESKSCLDTMNPWKGFQLIPRMGSIYWETMAIVFVLNGARLVFVPLLGMLPLPFLGTLAGAFVSAFVFLSTGCTLGFAIRKRAPEMGLE